MNKSRGQILTVVKCHAPSVACRNVQHLLQWLMAFDPVVDLLLDSTQHHLNRCADSSLSLPHCDHYRYHLYCLPPVLFPILPAKVGLTLLEGSYASAGAGCGASCLLGSSSDLESVRPRCAHGKSPKHLVMETNGQEPTHIEHHGLGQAVSNESSRSTRPSRHGNSNACIALTRPE